MTFGCAIDIADGAEKRCLMPRTVLKTREVLQHVVVADVRPVMQVVVPAEVIDEFRNISGGLVPKSRVVKSRGSPLTKSQLVQQVVPEDSPIVEKLLERLESSSLDLRSTAQYLSFRFTFPVGGDSPTLVCIGTSGLWTQALKPLRDTMRNEVPPRSQPVRVLQSPRSDRQSKQLWFLCEISTNSQYRGTVHRFF